MEGCACLRACIEKLWFLIDLAKLVRVAVGGVKALEG